MLTALDRLEQGGAQCRCQHQGAHDGKRHRRDDGDGELAIDHPGRAAEERHRQEHRRQHQTDADQRPGDFLHRAQSGVARRQAFLAHDAFDIFHHHDGVIDQKADHQHQCEQGQGIDGIAHHRQHTEGAQQHHRHRHGRHQGGAPVLQEDEHHQDHQCDGFGQGLGHIADRQADEIGIVDRKDQLHAGREGRLQRPGTALDRIHKLQRVGAGRGRDGDTRGGMTVHLADNAVIVGAQFDPRHIRQMNHGAIDG